MTTYISNRCIDIHMVMYTNLVTFLFLLNQIESVLFFVPCLGSFFLTFSRTILLSLFVKVYQPYMYTISSFIVFINSFTVFFYIKYKFIFSIFIFYQVNIIIIVKDINEKMIGVEIL